MNAKNADKKEQQGMQNCFTATTPFNQLEFMIEQKIMQMVNTAALVRVDGCTSTGAEGPAGKVSATPMVAQTDAHGNALGMSSIPSMPHVRYQAGIAAIILDPVPGDLGVAVFCKSDSSTVETGTTEPQRPGSFRKFSQADGVLVGAVSNQAPQVWIELKQDKTIIIHAPEGVKVETDKNVEVTAGQKVSITAPAIELNGVLTMNGHHGGKTNATLNGSLTATDELTADSVPLSTHTHGGVDTGDGNTASPNR